MSLDALIELLSFSMVLKCVGVDFVCWNFLNVKFRKLQFKKQNISLMQHSYFFVYLNREEYINWSKVEWVEITYSITWQKVSSFVFTDYL